MGIARRRLERLGLGVGIDSVHVSMWLSHHGGDVEETVAAMVGRARWDPSPRLGPSAAAPCARPRTATATTRGRGRRLPTFSERDATLTQRLSNSWFGLREIYAHHEMHSSLVENAQPRVETKLRKEVRRKRRWLKKGRETTAARMIKDMSLPDTLACGADLQKVMEWRRRRDFHQRQLRRCAPSLSTRLPDHVTRYERQRTNLRNKALSAGRPPPRTVSPRRGALPAVGAARPALGGTGEAAGARGLSASPTRRSRARPRSAGPRRRPAGPARARTIKL